MLQRRLSVGCMLRELMTDIGMIKGTQNYCHKSITLHSNNLVRPGWPATLQKLLADVCPTQFGRDKIDCSHAKCRRCCFYFCDNFHFPTNKKEEKTIAAVIYYKKLNILSALINIYLNFKISTSSSQTIPFQFLYFLSRPNCVGQTSAKSFWSVICFSLLF